MAISLELGLPVATSYGRWNERCIQGHYCQITNTNLLISR